MLVHYLSTALRHFRRFKIATTINVVCLALGIACLVLTYAVVNVLAQSDAHFANAARIQVITANLDAPAVRLRFDDMPMTGPVVAQFVRADFPDLEAVARRTSEQSLAVSTGGSATFASVSFADAEFLRIFDLRYRAGAGAASLSSPSSAVVTDEAANRIFGTTQVIGRRLRIGNREDVTIAAVIEKIPQPTRMRFELLVSMDVHDALLVAGGKPAVPSPSDFGNWWWLADSHVTYALLPADADAAAFRARLRGFSVSRIPRHEGGNTLSFGSTPLPSVFLRSLDAQLGGFTRSSLSVVTIGYVLAGLVLLIACFNYANLASALTAARAKEASLRRALGSTRSQMGLQHLIEATLVGLAALVIVTALVALCVPLLQRIGFEVTASLLLRPAFAAFVLIVLGSVALVGGAYPAFMMSSIRPTQALRFDGGRGPRRIMPAVLVVGQFAASSFLIITILVIGTQNSSILRIGSTLSADPVVVLGTGMDVAGINAETLRTRLLESPAVMSVSAVGAMPMSFTARPFPLARSPEPGAANVSSAINNVSYDFFRTFDIDLLAGRDFSRDRGDDVNQPAPGRNNHVVIGAGLATGMGWLTPMDAVGQSVYFLYGNSVSQFEIIGVAEEKPMHLMGMGTRSSVYFLTPPAANYAVARISRNDVAAGLAHIDRVWNALAPDVPARRAFVDDLLEQTYRTLFAINVVLIALAVLGSAIATMSLFATAVYVTDRRRHEIGVRKTIGARTTQVFAMLLRDFSRPIVIANLIAWPLAFLAAQMYLRLFAERIELTAVPFAMGLAITLVVAWLAVGSRAYRAARVKPAEVLRYE